MKKLTPELIEKINRLRNAELKKFIFMSDIEILEELEREKNSKKSKDAEVEHRGTADLINKEFNCKMPITVKFKNFPAPMKTADILKAFKENGLRLANIDEVTCVINSFPDDTIPTPIIVLLPDAEQNKYIYISRIKENNGKFFSGIAKIGKATWSPDKYFAGVKIYPS